MKTIGISAVLALALAVPGQANAQSVLIYEVNNDLVETAANNLGLTVTKVIDEPNFATQYDSGTWDVVVAATPTGGFGTDTYDRMIDRADADLPLIWSFWDTDSQVALLAAFEVTAVELNDPPTVVSDPASPVDFLSTIGGTLTSSNTSWADNGDDFTPTGGGFIAATRGVGGPGSIVVTNNDTSVLNGFLFDNYTASDGDGDGLNDMVEVIEQQLIYLTGPQQLTITGACPGPVTISGVDLTPGASIAVYRGVGSGSAIIPGGACAGTASSFFNLIAFHGTVTANALGEITLSPSVPGAACGTSLQLQDLGTCALTNTAAF